MRIAILSAGPSLKRTWRGNFQYSYTIAVNSALAWTRTDWLCAGDRDTLIRLGEHRPFVGVWTMADVVETPPPGWERARLIGFNHFQGWKGLARPGTWSIQAAIAGAYEIGSTVVDVYGHDMAGDHDVIGRAGADRSEERWERERLDWQASLDWASSHGLTINRIQE